MECPIGTFRTYFSSEEVCKPCGDRATSDEIGGRWCCMFSTKMKMLILLCNYKKLGILAERVVRETEATMSILTVVLSFFLYLMHNELFNVNVAKFL